MERLPAWFWRSVALLCTLSINAKAIVCHYVRHFFYFPTLLGARGDTYIDNTFDLTQNSRDRLANDRNNGEEARLANEDVEEYLMHPHKLTERIEDSVRLCSGGHRRHALHLSNSSGRGGHDIGKAEDDLL